jgi:hypothetical protein
VAILEPDSPLAYALRETEGWRVLHHSSSLEMLAAPAGWVTES